MNQEEKDYIEKLPYPVSFSCVDIIAADWDNTHIVMITKKGDPLLRLPGGFVDTTDLNYKEAAIREFSEECGETLHGVTDCQKSVLTSDRGRYNPSESKHRLRTHIVRGTLTLKGDLKAGDDAETAQFIEIRKFQDIDWVIKNVIPGHIPIIFWFLGKINK